MRTGFLHSAKTLVLLCLLVSAIDLIDVIIVLPENNYHPDTVDCSPNDKDWLKPATAAECAYYEPVTSFLGKERTCVWQRFEGYYILDYALNEDGTEYSSTLWNRGYDEAFWTCENLGLFCGGVTATPVGVGEGYRLTLRRGHAGRFLVPSDHGEISWIKVCPKDTRTWDEPDEQCTITHPDGTIEKHVSCTNLEMDIVKILHPCHYHQFQDGCVGSPYLGPENFANKQPQYCTPDVTCGSSDKAFTMNPTVAEGDNFCKWIPIDREGDEVAYGTDAGYCVECVDNGDCWITQGPGELRNAQACVDGKCIPCPIEQRCDIASFVFVPTSDLLTVRGTPAVNPYSGGVTFVQPKEYATCCSQPQVCTDVKFTFEESFTVDANATLYYDFSDFQNGFCSEPTIDLSCFVPLEKQCFSMHLLDHWKPVSDLDSKYEKWRMEYIGLEPTSTPAPSQALPMVTCTLVDDEPIQFHEKGFNIQREIIYRFFNPDSPEYTGPYYSEEKIENLLDPDNPELIEVEFPHLDLPEFTDLRCGYTEVHINRCIDYDKDMPFNEKCARRVDWLERWGNELDNYKDPCDWPITAAQWALRCPYSCQMCGVADNGVDPDCASQDNMEDCLENYDPDEGDCEWDPAIYPPCHNVYVAERDQIVLGYPQCRPLESCKQRNDGEWQVKDGCIKLYYNQIPVQSSDGENYYYPNYIWDCCGELDAGIDYADVNNLPMSNEGELLMNISEYHDFAHWPCAKSEGTCTQWIRRNLTAYLELD